MTEYVTKENVKTLINGVNLKDQPASVVLTCLQVSVNMLPDEDVRPVKRGKWFWSESGCRCTNCGRYANEESRYCPNCGAVMEVKG